MRIVPVVWLTGIPSSGKTTLGTLLCSLWSGQGKRCELIDGDELRQTICKDLGYHRGDRIENSARAATIAAYLALKGTIPVVALVSPYREARDRARRLIGQGFVEIHVDCPLEVCLRRDVKGLYRKAMAGDVKELTGWDGTYERPMKPELEISTHMESPESCVERIVSYLNQSGFLHAQREAESGPQELGR